MLQRIQAVAWVDAQQLQLLGAEGQLHMVVVVDAQQLQLLGVEGQLPIVVVVDAVVVDAVQGAPLDELQELQKLKASLGVKCLAVVDVVAAASEHSLVLP